MLSSHLLLKILSQPNDELIKFKELINCINQFFSFFLTDREMLGLWLQTEKEVKEKRNEEPNRRSGIERMPTKKNSS